MKILQLDTNHPLIIEQLTSFGFEITEDYTSSYEEVSNFISEYDGLILRSRIPIDEQLLRNAKKLKFIGRVGVGLENIDIVTADELGITLFNAPEGNRDAVAEHVLAMLLLLMNRLIISSEEVKNGIWKREENRGDELLGKTFGIIGYGNMGKAVSKRLSGFGARVVFHDILEGLTDDFAQQVSLQELQKEADIVSLHIPLTKETRYMIDDEFVSKMNKNFYFVNTSRGGNVLTSSIVKGLQEGKIIAAALDVLEYEKSSFESLDVENQDYHYLLNSDKVLITPHIAGWTYQSKVKLAQVIVDKIIEKFQK